MQIHGFPMAYDQHTLDQLKRLDKVLTNIDDLRRQFAQVGCDVEKLRVDILDNPTPAPTLIAEAIKAANPPMDTSRLAVEGWEVSYESRDGKFERPEGFHINFSVAGYLAPAPATPSIDPSVDMDQVAADVAAEIYQTVQSTTPTGKRRGSPQVIIAEALRKAAIKHARQVRFSCGQGDHLEAIHAALADQPSLQINPDLIAAVR
jgi:hypothetical protein